MGFDSEHYTMYMYVSITIVTFLIFFNSINIVETGLNGISEDGKLGKGLTGFIVEEINEDRIPDKRVGKFDTFLEGLKTIDLEDKKEIRRSRFLTGLAVVEDEEDSESEFVVDLDEEEPVEINVDGELYTEGSYMIYFMLLGFLGFCIFILSAVFFLPKLKSYT